MSQLFYLQDSRGYVGNDVMWWAKNGQGYTTDLRNAQLFTIEEAQRQHNSRPSDIPWPKDYIDAKTRPAVDMQYIKRDEALASTGIELRKEERRPDKKTPKCEGCGRYLSEGDFWSGECPNCGMDNRP
jgi:hypothetical protein